MGNSMAYRGGGRRGGGRGGGYYRGGDDRYNGGWQDQSYRGGQGGGSDRRMSRSFRTDSGTRPPTTGGKQLCAFYHTKTCEQGSSCKFLHLMTIRCEQKDKNFRACPLVPNIHVSALATSPADATSALPMTIYIGGKKMCKAFNVVAGGTEGFRYGDVGTLEVTGSAVTCLSVSSRATFLVVGYEDTLLPAPEASKLVVGKAFIRHMITGTQVELKISDAEPYADSKRVNDAIAVETYNEANQLISVHVFTAGEDGTIRRWLLEGLEKATLVEVLGGHIRAVMSLLLLEETGVLISGSKDKTLRVWKWDGNNNRWGALCICGYTGTFASPKDLPEPLDVQNPATGSMESNIVGHTDIITKLLKVPCADGQIFIGSASLDGKLKMWNSHDFGFAGQIESKKWIVSAVVVSCGRDPMTGATVDMAVVVGLDDGSIEMYSISRNLELMGTCFAKSFSCTSTSSGDKINRIILAPAPQEGHFVTATTDGTVRVWAFDGY